MRLEHRIAARLSVPDAAPTEIEAACAAFRGPFDWDAFADFGVREGTAAVLHAALAAGPPAACAPPRTLERLRGLRAANTARNLLHALALEKILAACAGRGCEVAVLKGPHAAAALYPDPGLRPMGDLDLLVRPGGGGLREAAAILESLGYRAAEPVRDEGARGAPAYRNSALFMRPGGGPGAVVHLHWHVVNAVFPVPFYRGADAGAVWAEMVPWTFRGVPARVPSPRFLPAFLAEHALKHSFDPLIRLVDVRLALRAGHRSSVGGHRSAVDRGVTGDRGLRTDDPVPFGLGPALEIASRAAEALFGPLPGGGVSARRDPALDGVCRLVATRFRRAGLCHAGYLAVLPTLRERLGLLRGTLWPERTALAALEGIPEEEVRPGHYVRRTVRGIRWAMKWAGVPV